MLETKIQFLSEIDLV